MNMGVRLYKPFSLPTTTSLVKTTLFVSTTLPLSAPPLISKDNPREHTDVRCPLSNGSKSDVVYLMRAYYGWENRSGDSAIYDDSDSTVDSGSSSRAKPAMFVTSSHELNQMLAGVNEEITQSTNGALLKTKAFVATIESRLQNRKRNLTFRDSDIYEDSDSTVGFARAPKRESWNITITSPFELIEMLAGVNAEMAHLSKDSFVKTSAFIALIKSLLR